MVVGLLPVILAPAVPKGSVMRREIFGCAVRREARPVALLFALVRPDADLSNGHLIMLTKLIAVNLSAQ